MGDMQPAITPRKQKERYQEEVEEEHDLQALLPFNADAGDIDGLDMITSQWNQALTMISHIDEGLKAWQVKVGHNVYGLEGKVQMVDLQIGWPVETLDGCITIWDGLMVVNEIDIELQKGWNELMGKLVSKEKKMDHVTKSVLKIQDKMNQLSEIVQVICQEQQMIVENLERE